MTAPAHPSRAGTHVGSGVLERSRRYRRRAAWAYGLSAVLHVLGLLLYPRLFGGLPETRFQGASETVVELQGIELLNLLETTGEVAEPEPLPELETERVPLPVAPRAPVTQPAPARPDAAVEAEPEAGGLSAAQRLQPSTSDERLWQPIPDRITALSPEQRIENLLMGRIQSLNDSSALAAARAARATDWTYTDGEGNRWGVSPGKLHLGPVTLPLPFAFGLPGGSSDILRRAYEQDAEIRRAAGQAGVDQSLEERNEIMRRRAEERRRARPDTLRTPWP